MLIIDVHTHIFPQKIAANAVKGISKFYDYPCYGDGTLEGLVRCGDEAGISRFVAHSVATTPGQMRHINEFIMGAHDAYPDRVIPFAALHPDVPGLEERVEEIIAQGFAGVKLHPDMQQFQIDEPRSLRMLRLLEGRLPVLIHTGDKRYDNSGPLRILHVREELPKLTMICAHLGGWSEWEKAAALLPGHDLYVDTSSSLHALTPERAAEIIRAYGVENVLFGTDFPMWTPDMELEKFYRLPLTDAERELILGKNAERLFGGEKD